MDALDVSRWQFGITTVYHFIFGSPDVSVGRGACGMGRWLVSWGART